ncbi:MAG: hypothetical protein CM15mP70_18170 [Pelagibacteraceae bacterium]|nr:MAG: hypothetical protein CM15mP70_18170 [Pelagibacteraceae bacterium]
MTIRKKFIGKFFIESISKTFPQEYCFKSWMDISNSIYLNHVDLRKKINKIF